MHVCGASGVYFTCFVFFKQKTAYEMRISDWSSDVCSSDLPPLSRCAGEGLKQRASNSPSPAQREREARSAGVRARLLLHTNSHAHPTTPSPQPLSRSAGEGLQPPMR